MKILEVNERTAFLIEELLNSWEASVQATHLFLSDAEVNHIKSYVPQAFEGVEHLIIAEAENNELLGFMGIENQKVIVYIRDGKEFCQPRNNIYDRFMSGPVNPIFYKFFVKANAFQANNSCIGCGQCVKKCPLGNIHLEQEKPVWGKKCTHCMACICYCPTEAIEYGKKSVGKPRYHFEAL